MQGFQKSCRDFRRCDGSFEGKVLAAAPQEPRDSSNYPWYSSHFAELCHVVRLNITHRDLSIFCSLILHNQVSSVQIYIRGQWVQTLLAHEFLSRTVLWRSIFIGRYIFVIDDALTVIFILIGIYFYLCTS